VECELYGMIAYKMNYRNISPAVGMIMEMLGYSRESTRERQIDLTLLSIRCI